MSQVDRAEHVAGQSFVIGVSIALVSGLLGGLFAAPLIAVVAPDPDVVALGTIYVQITFLMLGATICHQLFSGVLSGAGDTTTPMLITFATTPVSIVLEWALAFGHFGLPAMGIAGVALGAGLGSIAGALGMFWALFSGRCRVHIRMRHLIPDAATIRQVLALSWQPALHMVARTTIIFFFMFLAGRLGSKVQAAYTIGLRIEMLFIMIAFPVANSCATLVGQNLGAGDVRRSWQAIWMGFAVETAILWPSAVSLYFFREPLVGLFTSDPAVASLAAEYLAYSSAILVFYGFYFVSFRALQAAGDMNSPMIISISCALLLGAPLGFFLATRSDLGATGMWVANLVYAVVNTLATVVWLLLGRWQRRTSGLVVPLGEGT
jgi:putative MATE family efflux protein